MANIHEITRNLIQMRGEVKAVIIESDDAVWKVKISDSNRWLKLVVDTLKSKESKKFTGTIWFQSGSYAYLDKDGAGYYWNYVQVPEIPEELK
jgi:hypothetical protein